MIGKLTHEELYPKRDERFGIGDIVETEYGEKHLIVYIWGNHNIRLVDLSSSPFFARTYSRCGHDVVDWEAVERGWTLKEISSWYRGLRVVLGHHRAGVWDA